MISQNYKFSMKNTHRKVFPRWAFPFNFSPSQPGITEGLRAAYNEMLVLIQDQIIRPKPLSTLEPYPQTSAQMTPAHQRRRTGDDFDQGLLSGWFSSNTITVPERFPAVRVPALYLPADDDALENLRRVSVDAYERSSSDIAERCFMPPQEFAGKEIIFAFQLLMKPKPSSDAVEIRKSIWRTLSIDDYDDDLRKTFKLYYRQCGDGLAPNPYMVSIWRKLYGEEHQFFPWKGDIFVVLCRETHDRLRPVEVVPEPFTLDHLKLSSELQLFFKAMNTKMKGEFAKSESEYDGRFVSERLEMFSRWTMERCDRKE